MIDRVSYLISTHKDYQLPLRRLLSTIPSGLHTIVVSGGHTGLGRGARYIGDVLHIEVAHNSFDYTALIEVVEGGWEVADHIFLLHDTMEMGPQSDALLRAADPSLDATAVWGGECNLCLYRADYLRSRADELLSLKDCTKFRAVQVEGFLWRALGDERRGTYAGAVEIGEAEPVYGGTPRQRVHYTAVDIVKWKANWGQTWPPSVVTP